MKPNEKTRGGFVALVVPEEPMSWDTYKSRYGIDLKQLFELPDDKRASNIRIKTDKPLYLCNREYYNALKVAPIVTIILHIDNDTPSNNWIDLVSFLSFDADTGTLAGMYGIRIFADREEVSSYEL